MPPSETNEEIADATVHCSLRTVPAAVPGIAFLSGGQSGELASARLSAMNARFKGRLPWGLAFSFARAIQEPAMQIWHGEDANVPAAQKALVHRARAIVPLVAANTRLRWRSNDPEKRSSKSFASQPGSSCPAQRLRPRL